MWEFLFTFYPHRVAGGRSSELCSFKYPDLKFAEYVFISSCCRHCDNVASYFKHPVMFRSEHNMCVVVASISICNSCAWTLINLSQCWHQCFWVGPQGSAEGWNTLRWALSLFVIHNNNPGPLVAVVRGDILDSRKVAGGFQIKKKKAFFL